MTCCSVGVAIPPDMKDQGPVIEVEKDCLDDEGQPKLRTFVHYLTMTATYPLTTHVLDQATGRPGDGINISLYKQNGSDQFEELEKVVTDTDGRSRFQQNGTLQSGGIYKLYFNTGKYFTDKSVTGFYPFVEVVFRVDNTSQHYHVPLLLSPYGYSTYRGS